MDDLNALFDSVEGLSEDLKEYVPMGAAIIGAGIAWNFAVKRFMPPNLLSPQLSRFAIPAAQIVVGIWAGRQVSRRWNRRVGLGVTLGLVTAGVAALANQFAPGLVPAAVPGVAGYEGYAGLFGAPVTYEDVGPGMAGGPITVEESYGGGEELSYAAVAQ